MEAIVAVYADWGIGDGGTQPVVLKADRAHFREKTEGHAVLVGRKTLEDFPGKKPLPNRDNLVLTSRDVEIPGARVVHSAEEALAAAKDYDRCFVIGGASVYKQLFPYIDRVFVTRIDLQPHSDSFFPDLDKEPGWVCMSQRAWAEEDGVRYQFCTYERI
ncbi:MAG: dihydrofolate reductase [Oscillospiraceae bacterium]|nr:dihydrofolate reductase [Oscillospiraceae bacterium]